MKSYSNEQKERSIKKVKSGKYRTICSVAKEEGIPNGTLYGWLNPKCNDQKISKQKKIKIQQNQVEKNIQFMEVSENLHSLMNDKVSTKKPSMRLTTPSGITIELFS